jgi:hypothetical protein
MKIKVDHVTNSSSEVFAVVVQDSLVVGGLVAGMTALFNAHRLQFSNSDLTLPQMVDLNQASHETAKLMTHAMIEDAKANETTMNEAFDQSLSMIEDAQLRLRQELQATQRLKDQLQTSPNAGLPDSTEPQILFQQASDYEHYLTTQLHQSDALKAVIQEKQAAVTQTLNSPENAIDASKREWLDLQHEKKLLQSVADGHGPLGYDTTPTLERLQELNAKDDELFKLIAKNDTLTTWANRPFPAKFISEPAKALQAQLVERKEVYKKALKEKGLTVQQKAALKSAYDADADALNEQLKRQNRYDLATQAVDGATYGVDALVDLMSLVEVPFGGLFKTAYLAAKAGATQAKGGLHDRKHAGRYLAKGLIAAAGEVVKGTLGVGQPHVVQAATILTSGLHGGLDASIKGQAVGDALGKAMTKSLIDTSIANQLSALTVALPDPKDKHLNEEAYTLSDVISDNPLTQAVFNVMFEGASVETIKAAL